MKKPLIVQKFGGTSVGSIERILNVAEHIIKAKNDGNRVVVVVSAMSGETNRLMGMAKEIDSVPTARELDVLLSAGEQVSMALLSMTLNKMGYSARSLTGAQAGIVTDSQYNDATIKQINTDAIDDHLANGDIVIVAGFQGVNDSGDITTLGRGGSDTTAVALAGALHADECQIFTDVDGVYSCDPRIVKSAVKLEEIDFPSMEKMAQKGAKVLHLPSVQFAWQHRVPLRVLSSFEPGGGTLVRGETCSFAVCGLAIARDMCLIKIDNDECELVFKQAKMLGIEIGNVIECAEWTGIIIKQDSVAKLALVFEEKIRNSEAVSLLTAVGLQAEGLVEHSYELLAEHKISIEHYALDKQSLMLVVAQENVERAANILHDAYITSNEVVDIRKKQLVLG